MARYPSHIYISALPLAASHLNLMKHYIQYYPRTLSLRQPAQLPRWTFFHDQNSRQNFLRTAALSPKGKYIAAVFNASIDGLEGTQLLDAATGDLLWISEERPEWVSFSAEDKYVAFLHMKTLQLRNATTGEIERSEVFYDDFFAESVAFAPSSMYAAVGGTSGVKCWNVEEWTFFEVYTPESASFVAFSLNGQQIISVSRNQTIYIWDLSESPLSLISTINYSSPQCIHPLTRNSTNALVVSNTEIAFTSGDIIHLWDVRSNRSRHLMMERFDKALSCSPFSLSFSPNGRCLASGTIDGVGIWDTCEEKYIANLVGHSSNVHSVAFFPDGSRIMSASWDGTVRVWDIGSLLEEKREEMDDWVPSFLTENRVYSHDYHGKVIVDPHRDDILFSGQYPFRHPRNTLVIGPCLDIDFSHFVHGIEWVRCREPLETKDGTNITERRRNLIAKQWIDKFD